MALSTESVTLLELSSRTPPLLLSMAVTLAPRALFRAAIVTFELIARPAAASPAAFSVNEWMRGRMNGCMDGWMDGWMNNWVMSCMNE